LNNGLYCASIQLGCGIQPSAGWLLPLCRPIERRRRKRQKYSIDQRDRQSRPRNVLRDFSFPMFSKLVRDALNGIRRRSDEERNEFCKTFEIEIKLWIQSTPRTGSE
jgi:hypothetical protein